MWRVQWKVISLDIFSFIDTKTGVDLQMVVHVHHAQGIALHDLVKMMMG